MVTYQQWFEVVQEAAAGVSRRQRNSLTSDLAAYWRENRDDLEELTKSEARQLAEEIVET